MLNCFRNKNKVEILQACYYVLKILTEISSFLKSQKKELDK